MVEGAALGLALTFAVGVVTFVLQRKLPYKRMLVVTGVMIGFVLVVMVGQTARTMQGVGWLPITPIGGDPPLLARRLVRRLPDLGDARRPGFRRGVRDRLLLVAKELKVKRPTRRAQRQAPPAPPSQEPVRS